MDNKKIAAIFILSLFVIGGVVMLFGGKENTSANSNQQTESYDEMMLRMHPPSQQASDDMSSHHSQDVADKSVISSLIGKPASDFTLTKNDGSKFALSDYKDKTVVLFFNEGAMCYPACWEQMAFLGVDKRFDTNEVISASIVTDEKSKWDQIVRAQPKYGRGVILFDTDAEVSKAYGVLNLPSSMHKGELPGHTYVIIKNGVISYVLDDPNMALNNDELAQKL
ncbi:MAG: redoxin domain-containing protein [Nanoarchaeota archaeon]